MTTTIAKLSIATLVAMAALGGAAHAQSVMKGGHSSTASPPPISCPPGYIYTVMRFGHGSVNRVLCMLPKPERPVRPVASGPFSNHR